MKKSISLLIILLFSALIFANPAKEDKETVKLAVMQGPTGFSSAFLPSFIETEIYPSPNEAVAKIINGELDMAVLPANTAASLYNKGVKIKALAIVGEGMLSIVGTENSGTINVPGLGTTPDHMARLLYPEYEPDYSITAPAQLAQMVIAGKVKLAILPQPFVSMVLSSNPQVKEISDVQARWKTKTGEDQFPMSILVVNEKYYKENSHMVKKVKDAFKTSIEEVLAKPQEASTKIEELKIMKASLAGPAIPKCALIFKTGKAAETEADSYFSVLKNLAPEAIGNSLPDKDFWI